MNIEYEARILEVNTEELEKKIKELGGKFVSDFDQKRYVYDVIPKQEAKWIRLRKANDETTLTIKDISSKTISGTKELEIKVDDFEKTNLLLEELGFTNKGYQENKRRRYILDGVEIDIDSWPKIPTYIEIEGKNEEEVKNTIHKLGYSDEEIVTLDVENIYRKYGFELEEIRILKFEEEKND